MKQPELKDIVYKYKDQMYRLALSIMKNKDDAEDVLQDVFVKCWEQKKRIEKSDSIKSYLFKMTRNRCLDVLKKHSRKYENEQLENYESMHTVENNLDQIEKLKIVNMLIDKLPEQNKTIIRLRETESMEFNEIEKITGLKQDNIRTILSRTKKKLKQQLEKVFEYQSEYTT